MTFHSNVNGSHAEMIAFSFLLSESLPFHKIFMPGPFSMEWVGGGAYSITAVRTYVCPIHPVRNSNGFHSISFEKISVLDSNFIHRYIIIKCWSS